MSEFVKVATINEIGPGQIRLVTAKGRDIALFNLDGEFFALDNLCTHDDGPLAEGEISGHEIICPFHGEVLGQPAYEAVTHYDARVTGVDVEVAV